MGARRAILLVGFLLAGATLGAWVSGRLTLARTFEVPVPTASSKGDPERGRHLVEHVLACGTCHGDDLGGAVLRGGMLAGALAAPNLTGGVGGVGVDYTSHDWRRSIRHGVDPGGRGLVFMRTRRWAGMSEQDLADVVAWLQRLPPVDRVPEPGGSALGLPLVVGLGGGVDAAVVRAGEPPEEAPPWGPDAAYGRYLAHLAGCLDCHGPDLRGGRVPWSEIAAPDISPESGSIRSGAAFARAVREGRGAGDRPLDPVMPSRYFAGLHDTELDALWSYVRQGADGVVGTGVDAP